MDRKERLLTEESIKSNALDYEVDETVVGICPFCKAAHETSLSVTRTDQGLLYNCFRAACGAKGFISSLAGTIPPDTKDIKLKKFKVHEFTGELEPLPKHVKDWMFKKYELTEEELNEQGIKFCRSENRLFMPVFDYRGEEFGGISKTLTAGVKKFKTINYFTRESNRLSYSRSGRTGEGAIVIVEDILSAIKVSRYKRAVALLGHTLSIPQIKELRNQTDSIILMLDGDVFHKAVQIKKKFGFYFRNFSVVYLSNGLDPKDLESNKLEEIINE